MSDPIFWRVFWKEYRQLRAFWLAIALFAIAMEGIVVVVALAMADEVPVETLFGIALILPVFYGLGCGAFLFAGEHEMETFDFQRALPVSAGKLVGGKLGFAIPSAILLPCVLWLTAWLFAGRAIPATNLQSLGHWLFSISVSIQLLAWGVLFSLLIGRVLWATILATGCVSFLGILAIPGLDFFFWGRTSPGIGNRPFMLIMHVVVTLLVLAVDVWLGRRWLREAPLPWSRVGQRARESATTDGDRSEPRIAPWGRLLWNGWRQARGPLTLILGTAAVIAVLLTIRYLTAGFDSESFWIPLFFAPVIAAIVGSTVFWSDQRKAQFRFFTERGIGPRRVWASRLLIGLAAVLLWYLVASVCLTGELLDSSPSRGLVFVEANRLAHERAHYEISNDDVMALLGIVGAGLLFFAVGQICSLCIRSGVIGLFVGLMFGWLANMWALGMWILRVPLWFTVAPIPLILLWAGWLRAPDWMAERASWRSRSRLALTIIVPLVAVFVSMVCLRVYEIPVVQPAISAREKQRTISPDGLKTLMLYIKSHREFQAIERRSSTPVSSEDSAGSVDAEDQPEILADSQRQEALERAVATFTQASRREQIAWAANGRFHNLLDGRLSGQDLTDARSISSYLVDLANEVLATCEPLEQEGRLEKAFERYLAVLAYAGHVRYGADSFREHRADAIEALVLERLPDWAAREGQTAETIREALRRLDSECLSATPSRRNTVVNDYLRCKHVLGLSDDAAKSAITANEAFTVWFLSRFLPWEHARVGRLVDIYASNELDRVQAVHDALAAGKALPEESRSPLEKQLAGWTETTTELPVGIGSDSNLHRLAGLCETRRRVVRLQLALAAWRAEHGQLPRSLDRLVGTELDSLPVDPFTGLSFQYIADGSAAQLSCRNALELKIWTQPEETSDQIEANTPFLWSAGPDMFYRRRRNSLYISGEPDTQFSHADFTFCPQGAQTAHWVTNDQELWSLGWCFPVP